ncbi:hypothetical protein HY969_01745 [Candidatus Kaiserbacteria bacterium]|nr:hypothetical protein [Candidatus Kaiserbacteria bacterium]
MKERRQRSRRSYRLPAALAGIVFLGVGTYAFGEAFNVLGPSASFDRSQPIVQNEKVEVEPQKPAVAHISTPDSVKAVYMSQCAAGTPSFRESLMHLIDTTELNSIVIDIRDYTGMIAFPTENPILKDMVSDECGARDMKEFLKLLHDRNIYVIGRITVFQNPYYTKVHPEQAVQHKNGGIWKDRKGLAFVDVGATAYWDTVVELAKESYEIGFDELNFDYIRYPSDGDMASAVYIKRDGKTKQEMLEDFFKYLHEQLEPIGVATSADLFGMTTTNTDDLNIGQVLERTLPYFDYIAPMVYPSHYPSGFHGYKNVNEHSYDIVHFSMGESVRRTIAPTTPVAGFAHERIGTSTPAIYKKPVYDKQKMRPWLQDFDYPVAYTPAMVQEQIKATHDAGLNSYMFWDPANKYDSLRQVLKAE